MASYDDKQHIFSESDADFSSNQVYTVLFVYYRFIYTFLPGSKCLFVNHINITVPTQNRNRSLYLSLSNHINKKHPFLDSVCFFSS